LALCCASLSSVVDSMKDKLKSLLLALALIVPYPLATVITAGCVSTERTAYRVTGVTVHGVDTAMKVWGDYVKSGKATLEQEIAVKAAYEQYQQAVVLAHIAVVKFKQQQAADPNASSTAVQAAFEGLDEARFAILGIIEFIVNDK